MWVCVSAYSVGTCHITVCSAYHGSNNSNTRLFFWWFAAIFGLCFSDVVRGFAPFWEVEKRSAELRYVACFKTPAGGNSACTSGTRSLYLYGKARWICRQLQEGGLRVPNAHTCPRGRCVVHVEVETIRWLHLLCFC